MKRETLGEAVALAERIGHAFVATASREGLPHLAAAGELALKPDGSIAVTEWFCPGTMGNVQENRRVSLVVWDPEADAGYQLVGEVVAVNDLAMLDGYTGDETLDTMPQTQWELILRLDEVLAFRQGPHSDIPGV